MKRLMILVLMALALAGCNDPDSGSGQSYSAPPPDPTPIPAGDPYVWDEREDDRLLMNFWNAVLENNETVERRNATR